MKCTLNYMPNYKSLATIIIKSFFSLSCLAQPVLRDKMGINAYYNFNSDLML